jgi:outer membrane protein assembly factor BamB
MYYIHPILILEYIAMFLSGPFRFEGDLSISILVYGENSMFRTTLKHPVFPGTLKIGLIAAVLVLVCIAPVFASTAAEPAVGWKYHGELNNTGLYNDGGFRPNGHELWNVSGDTGSDIEMVESSPAVVNGVVYVTDRGDTGHHLFAINATTGAIKWEKTLPDKSFTSPAVANGMVYVGTGWPGEAVTGHFYAFNASTGGSVWSKTLPNSPMGSSPAVAYGNVYVGRGDHHVSAWNAITGAAVWTYGTPGAVYSSPAVYNGTVYFSSPDTSGGDNIYAVNATTGINVWDAKNASGYDGTFTDAGSVLGSSPAVANGVLYIGGYAGVYAFDANTGAQLRKFHDTVGSYYLSTPAVANGLVYFGTHGASPHKFYALFANNFSVKWRNLTPDNTDMDSSPAIANGVVYVTSDRGNNDAKGFLYAWNATTGAPIWKFLPVGAGGTSSGPAVANGVVYFGTWWNGLYAVGTEPVVPLPTVTGISPTKGPTSGSSLVTVTGTGFTSATTVKFGTVAGTSLTVNSSTKITIRSPAHAAGIVDVRVTTPGGTSAIVAGDKFTYVARPIVSSISPTKGSTAGGTVVTVTGTGFTGATVVKFGTVAGTSRTVNSSTKITIKSPAHAAGIFDVTVTTPGGTSVNVAGDKFTYGAPPKVTKISPATGPTTGNTLVTINGTGFTGATAVKFGTVAGTSLTVVSASQITVRSPAHAAGIVDVRVTTPYGTSAIVTADRFTYMVP